MGASREPSDAVSESRREGVIAPVRDHLGAIPAGSPRLRLAGMDAYAARKVLSRHLHSKLYRGYSAARSDEDARDTLAVVHRIAEQRSQLRRRNLET